jgi:hypothetical protein
MMIGAFAGQAFARKAFWIDPRTWQRIRPPSSDWEELPPPESTWTPIETPTDPWTPIS